MIGISQFATDYLRSRSQDRMEDECRIFRQGAVEIGDDHTARRGTDIIRYEGRCRVWEVNTGNQVLISDVQVVVTQTFLSLPWDAPVPESDDIVKVIRSVDPDLEGRTLSVVSVSRGGGLRASRKILVRVVDSQRSNW